MAKEYAKAFYKSKAWKNKRQQILIRDNFECQLCKKKGKVKRGPGLNIHHIKHYDKYPELGLVDNNLITVCDNCHNKLHPEKGERLTKNKKIIHEARFK